MLQKTAEKTIFIPEDTLGAIKTKLKEVLACKGQMQSVLNYLQKAQGKMIRPTLVVLCAELCGKETDEKVLDIATGVELIHAASLVHDDIIDGDELRRGQESLNSRYGSTVAVLTGDYLFASAFSLFTLHNHLDILSTLTAAIKMMCEGEVDQFLSSGRDEDFYWWYIHRKTACLLGAACKSGAQLASSEKGGGQNEPALMEHFGLSLGYAFQLIDDILDYTGDEKLLGKTPGTDHREELWTLPLIRAEKRNILPPGWRDWEWPRIQALLVESGIIDEIYGEAVDMAERARSLLHSFPDCQAKDMLADMTSFVVSRTY